LIIFRKFYLKFISKSKKNTKSAASIILCNNLFILELKIFINLLNGRFVDFRFGVFSKTHGKS
jgi:hypothetical protein